MLCEFSTKTEDIRYPLAFGAYTAGQGVFIKTDEK